MAGGLLESPVLNSPYAAPARHFDLAEDGTPTGKAVDGRRRSQYLMPVPPPRKRGRQIEMPLEGGEQQVTENILVNKLRDQVETWRRLPPGQWGVSHTTERLLKHWRDLDRQSKLFFCQIEAVETVIWLTEVARGEFRKEIETANSEANPELFRIALKMATGSGKTTVMAMLIAWQAINKARTPQSRSFADAFLVITPGITVKDRLRVLLPADPGNIYARLDLVPRDLKDELGKAKIVITNYHAFKRRETLEASKLAKSVLKGRNDSLPTLETEGAMVARVCRDLMGRRQIVVLNDEAHHCYREKQGAEAEKLTADERAEAKRSAEAARLWIGGIEAIQRVLKTKAAVYDLSATPFFLRGSGYPEGTLFQWVVSDFSLMDAIECGIVKVPRVPVADDQAGEDLPRWRNLYRHIKLPKAGRAKQSEKEGGLDPEKLPALLLSALQALYDHYAETHRKWEAAGLPTPPVFIVVCNNTSTSKLVYDYLAGYETAEGGLKSGAFPLFSNVEHGRWLHRPNTLLIDSEQLDSGEAISADFKKLAAAEIEAFKRELRTRFTGIDADNISDDTLLREVMNTVGKPGRLGEKVRCVVSVSMLTEGWDANTVTHILGVRAFGTQLLCEQVVGRGLRRVSYDTGPDGLLEPEYADILGIPFVFMAGGKAAQPQPPKPSIRVHAVEGRENTEIRFPRVLGYRIAWPADRLEPRFTADSTLTVNPDDAPRTAEVEGIVGEGHMINTDSLKQRRESEIAFHIAGYGLRTRFRDPDGNLKPFLFPSLLAVTRRWMQEHLVCRGGTFPQYLLWRQLAEKALDKIYAACVPAQAGQEMLRPMLDPFNPGGSSRFVDFRTTKQTLFKPRADKCQINEIVYDSDWEVACAQALEALPEVMAYVKNHSLGFEVPYVLGGDERHYRPDFIALIDDGGTDGPLHLVLEIKGYRAIDAQAKADTMTRLWVPAVNNARRFGRWSFLELPDKWDMDKAIRAHLATLSTARAA